MSFSELPDDSVQGVAIVGMAGRFPGAKNTDEFWRNLRAGVETVTFFSEEELISSGVEPALLKNPNYVKAKGVLADVDLFDAAFFGFSPREAEITDPQQRIFLECAWSALEDAGYNPDSYTGKIGVYAGAGWSSYLLFNLATHRSLLESEAGHQTLLGNEKDNLTTRVSYKLNLKGPSIDVQTGCSTSLVATCLAYQSLLNYQCDMALAGGVSITVPQTGYLYQTGGIFSPDGHCRAFDTKAQGTVIGSGAGIVVLKRLEDAIADGDNIYAVLKAAAINNDGALKAGYTAPSVEGQAEVIVEAQAIAEIAPETITYVEAHGTATALGDPIEIAALTKAFRAGTPNKSFCAIGSVKTNIGHLDAAAGVAGLIKTVLSLKHKEIPPSLHFEQPNPQIDFLNSPFYVNTSLSRWETGGIPRRAAVSSFGLGGTNAHVILEEAAVIEPPTPEKSHRLLVLSAKTGEALENATTNLADHLKQHPEANLADVAYTLQVGRKGFNHRRVLVCDDVHDAAQALAARDPQRVFSQCSQPGAHPVAFMFSGQGAQYVHMARELYQAEPTFRSHADTCFNLLKSHHNLDLRSILYPSDGQVEEAEQRLKQTENAQPSLFVIEYALAQMWMSWGIGMQAAIGHSLGEYVAATLAGVFSLKDALALVTARGQLMQRLPGGAMLAIPLPEQDVPLDGSDLSLAAINEPSSCVVSGSTESVNALQRQLSAQGIETQYLHTSHAFHSRMTEPILEAFAERVKRVSLQAPKIPYISNVTGTWIKAAEATDSNYWVTHIRQTVRFADGLQQLLQANKYILLEVGPGRTLSQFAKRHPLKEEGQVALSTLRHPKEKQPDLAFLLNTLGQLWLSGVNVDWPGFSRHQRRRRLPLPTYSFDRQRYWIEPAKQTPSKEQPQLIPTSQELWQALVNAAQVQANSEIAGYDQTDYLLAKTCLDNLCVAYMNLTLRQLGAFSRPGERYSLELLLQQCQIIPGYQQLLSRWLEVLMERGHLQQEDGLFTNLLPCSAESVQALLQEAKLRWANTPQVVDLVQTCGEALADVLRGEQEPLELFESAIDPATRDAQPEMFLDTHYKSILRTGLRDVVKLLPPSVNLRILEIGGGTGIATKELLPALPSKQTNYTFTDVGKLFLSHARQKFSAYPFVDFGLLDIEKPPTEQGYPSQGFDVIIAVNMLHVTRNMDDTLEHVSSLLAPGGLLLIWEITQPALDFDITYGLVMNPVEDAERNQGNPFLSTEQWRKSLLAHGFAQVAVFPDSDVFGQHIMVAQAATAESSPALLSLSVKPAFTALMASQDGDHLSQASLLKKPDIADWFYVPSWKRSSAPQPTDPALLEIESECWLIFLDECGLGKQLIKRLDLESRDIVTVEAGERFNCESRFSYTINPRKQDDYDILFQELRAQNKWPAKIIHLWSVTRESPSDLTIESLENAQVMGLNSLLFLAQAIGEQKHTEPLDIKVVSNNMQEVTGDEKVSPEKALALAPCKVIPLEYPHVDCSSVDVAIFTGDARQDERVIDQLLGELQTKSSDSVVAYRGSHRWVQTFEPVRLNRPAELTRRLKKHGVYLITGGLGKVGLTLAEHLAKTVQAKLVLIGRSSFPQPEEWEQWLVINPESDRVSRILRKLRELESFGSEVMVMSADVADLKQMQGALACAQERFGAINGVIHSAGILGDSAIQQKTLDEVRNVLAPKVTGTMVLDTLFKDTSLDFFVLFSSLSANKPGFGQVTYSAANNFLDVFAHSHLAQRHQFTTCISWDVWQGEGMAYDAVTPLALQKLKEADFKQRGILPDEGVDVFSRILGSTLPHVLVSTSDYLSVLETDKPDLAQLYLETLKTTSLSTPKHSRPNLSNSYVIPRNETEQTLAQIWQELLGIEGIGVFDDFFELGGDSLIGTQLISRVKTSFGVKLPTKCVYLHPTIQSMSEAVEQALVSQASSERISELLNLLEGMK